MNVAPNVPENPVSHQFVGQRERHDHQAQKKISDGQRRNKPVLDVFQRFLGGNGNDDQHIADDNDDHEYCDDDRCEHDLGDGISTRIGIPKYRRVG